METKERIEKIMKLGLYMINEGFSKEEVTATMNSIHVVYLTEAISKLNFKGADSK